jgi:cardiolipin synthase
MDLDPNGLLGLHLPWWGWMLLTLGIIAVVSVAAALFVPEWPLPDLRPLAEAPAGSETFLRAVAGHLNVPVLRGGTATLLQNGDAFYPAMLEAIAAATESVHFQVYIFEPDEVGMRFVEAFIERARAGVEVRLMVDGFGALALRGEPLARMRAAGVVVRKFRPFKLRHLARIYKRDHRRAIVVDGRVAFTGGAAVSKKWKGDVTNAHEWRDHMTRVTGALVAGVQSAFAENWVYDVGEMIAGPRYFPATFENPAVEARIEASDDPTPRAIALVSSPSDHGQPIRLLFHFSFRSAQRRLWISNSYFIPDRHLRGAVAERARAGVDVRVLVPGNHTDAVPVQLAGRTYYEELLEAGVRIFEYLPSMMHAKAVVADDCWSIVGSSNLDNRSMKINEENVLGIADGALARQVAAGMECDFARSREIVLDEWRRRPLWKRGLEACAKILVEQY